jgi:hypothetical protein
MSTDKSWIDNRLSEARQGQRLVTEAVVARMKELLDGQLTERQLSAGKLIDISIALLADMTVSASVKEEGNPES